MRPLVSYLVERSVRLGWKWVCGLWYWLVGLGEYGDAVCINPIGEKGGGGLESWLLPA